MMMIFIVFWFVGTKKCYAPNAEEQ